MLKEIKGQLSFSFLMFHEEDPKDIVEEQVDDIQDRANTILDFMKPEGTTKKKASKLNFFQKGIQFAKKLEVKWENNIQAMKTLLSLKEEDANEEETKRNKKRFPCMKVGEVLGR